jgi:diguanylate cyclase
LTGNLKQLIAVVLVSVVLCFTVAALGVLAGWGLHYRVAGGDGGAESEEVRRAREVLARLHELALGVAADVGKHHSRVEEINEELISSEMDDPETVMTAVDKLVQANNRMQQQLAVAEEKLQQQAEQIVSHATAALTDPLTGLANRRAFDDAMVRCLRRFLDSAESFSVTMIDVDHFKQFNDTYGHQAGDEVLRGVARVLRANAGPNDLVARYGGEEFALIHRNTPLGEATDGVDRIRKLIDAATFDYDGTELRVSATFGVAEILQGDDAASLVARADEALYVGKEAGRNCTYWHDGEKVYAVRRHSADDGQRARWGDSNANDTHLPCDLVDRIGFSSAMDDALDKWRVDGAAPSVLLIQVDGFSEIVANLGTQAATVTIGATLQFLKAATRESDQIGHYGAETFAMLLPDTSPARATGVAERLRKAIADCRLPVDGTELRFSISLGGAEATTGDDSAQLLIRAQKALDAANRAGGNCTYFHNGQWSEPASEAACSIE